MSRHRAKLISTITDQIGRTNELATQMSHAAAMRIGINPTDMHCVQLLQRGPLTPGQLARLTGLTTASITGVVDRLEAAGLVRRERDSADRRRINVVLQLDSARRDVVPAFAPLLQRWRRLLDDYDDATLEAVAEILTRIDDALEEELGNLRDAD